MLRTSIAHQHCLLYYFVFASTVRRIWLDRMRIIDTAADTVPFRNPDATTSERYARVSSEKCNVLKQFNVSHVHSRGSEVVGVLTAVGTLAS